MGCAVKFRRIDVVMFDFIKEVSSVKLDWGSSDNSGTGEPHKITAPNACDIRHGLNVVNHRKKIF